MTPKEFLEQKRIENTEIFSEPYYNGDYKQTDYFSLEELLKEYAKQINTKYKEKIIDAIQKKEFHPEVDIMQDLIIDSIVN